MTAGYDRTGPEVELSSARPSLGEDTPRTEPLSPLAPHFEQIAAPDHAPVPVGPARRSRLMGTAFAFIALLMVVAAGQTYLLVRLNQRLHAAGLAAGQARQTSDSRTQGLESRVKDLERQAGKSLDAAVVAAEVTPSVFRVLAGDFSGTTFAISTEPADGGTDLLTNFHVVEKLYGTGGRDVALERDNKRYTAKIVKVGAGGKDIALLHTTEKFPRLQPAKGAAAPGQPVVVIGAPLGLESTVTSGVVSALRMNVDGPVLQFDAPINPGNSGGPVVNAQKQVVGIATAKANAAEGIGLAIPIAVACDTFTLC